MAAALQALGMRVVPGQANYLLFYCRQPLSEGLQALGVSIRSCENYPGLGPGWYRTAVKGEADNNVLVQRLREMSPVWRDLQSGKRQFIL